MNYLIEIKGEFKLQLNVNNQQKDTKFGSTRTQVLPLVDGLSGGLCKTLFLFPKNLNALRT